VRLVLALGFEFTEQLLFGYPTSASNVDYVLDFVLLVFEQFWQYIQCMPERNHHTTNAAWRLVVETWLRRQGWISVKEKTTTHVSTNSDGFFSQN